jgi:hypothetical protein
MRDADKVFLETKASSYSQTGARWRRGQRLRVEASGAFSIPQGYCSGHAASLQLRNHLVNKVEINIDQRLDLGGRNAGLRLAKFMARSIPAHWRAILAANVFMTFTPVFFCCG